MERELVLLRAGRRKYLSVVPATDVSKPRIAIERIESMPKCARVVTYWFIKRLRACASCFQLYRCTYVLRAGIPIEWLFTLVQDGNTVQLYPVR